MNLRKLLKFRPCVLGTIFAVLTCLCVTIYLAAAASRERYESVLAGQALTIRAMVDARLERVIAATRALSLDPSLDDLDDVEAIGSHAKALSDALGGRVVILRGGDSGQAVFDSRYPEGISRHIANGYPILDPFFAATKDTLVENHYAISDLAMSPRLGEYHVIVLVPIVRQERMVGAIALLLYQAALANLMHPTDVPTQQFAALLDGGNRIVDRTRGQPGERVGWPIPQWMSDTLAGHTRGVMSGIGMSGIDNMMAYQQLSTAPRWRVVVGEPNALINRFMLQPFLWIAVGGGCALIALAWWILAWRQRFARDTDILRTQKAQLSRLSRSMPALQFLSDVRPDGTFRMCYVGGDFARVTGWGKDDMTTVAQWERLRAPDTLPLREVMKAALENGSVMHEFRLRQADGSWRWMRGELTRIQKNPDGSGEVVGYIINVDDTRKAQQQALSSVHLSSVGKITASLANEKRRLLSAAHIAADILERELECGNTTLAVSRAKLIKDKIENVIRAHDQMRRFATNKGYAASLQPTSIDDVVAHVLDVVAPVLREDGVDVWVNIPPLGCPHVKANPIDLEQVVMSLLLNARDAILAHGTDKDRRISIQAIPNPAAEVVVIKIVDNGGGIPGNVLPRLFEPFVTTKQEAGNVGLDLTICNALMVRMGGAIDARNDDSGAIFTIVLPAAIRDADTGLAQET